jgi:hypothetical protein
MLVFGGEFTICSFSSRKLNALCQLHIDIKTNKQIDAEKFTPQAKQSCSSSEMKHVLKLIKYWSAICPL